MIKTLLDAREALWAENLLAAYDFMSSLPVGLIQLDSIRASNFNEELDGYDPVDDEALEEVRKAGKPCGTTACVAGWLSTQPKFKAQGLIANKYSEFDRNLSDLSHELFGDWFIFSASAQADGENYNEQKVEALRRIRLRLLDLGAITPERNEELRASEYEIAPFDEKAGRLRFIRSTEL